MEKTKMTTDLRRFICGSAAALLLLATHGSNFAQAILILTPSDPILAIDLEGGGSYPGPEGPSNVIDGTLNKYLNNGGGGNFGENSGFIVTPTVGAGVGTVVTSFVITTANDAENRDPASWRLYGTNDTILSLDNSNGNGGEAWALIDSGLLSLPSARNTMGSSVSVANTDDFTSYRMVFPTLKGTPGLFRMQIAEVQFEGSIATAIPEPSLLGIFLGLSGLVTLRRWR